MKNFSKLTLAAVLFVGAVKAVDVAPPAGFLTTVKNFVVDGVVKAKDAVVAAPGAAKDAVVAGYNAVTFENAKAAVKFPFQWENYNYTNAGKVAVAVVAGYAAVKAYKAVAKRYCTSCKNS